MTNASPRDRAQMRRGNAISTASQLRQIALAESVVRPCNASCGCVSCKTVVVVHTAGTRLPKPEVLLLASDSGEIMVAPDISNVTGTVGRGDIWSLYRRGGVLGKG
jgi:hypothetical protein